MAAPALPNAEGKLADNVVHFARLLRAAGMTVGPGQVICALEALKAAGVGARYDFYWILHATLVTSKLQRPVFDQAFALFWRKRGLTEKMMQMLLPETAVQPAKEKPRAGAQRVAEAFAAGMNKKERVREVTEFDARFTMSDAEVLQDKDFEQMSVEELSAARKALQQLVLPANDIRTRRYKAARRGHSHDARATLRASIRSGGDLIQLERRTHTFRPPPIVALVDISGSMSSYSRVLLHFLHGLTNAQRQVHTFLFGTRLTNVTRHMRARDADDALDQISEAAEDWSGGTRINSCMQEFVRHWSRRVLGQGATVILITDGLERESGDTLERQMERLHKSSRKLIWLNPLLRYDKFEAKASGIRKMLPHVDEFRPVHNLESIAELARALDGSARGVQTPRAWLNAGSEQAVA